jgi:hypothetical protein
MNRICNFLVNPIFWLFITGISFGVTLEQINTGSYFGHALSCSIVMLLCTGGYYWLKKLLVWRQHCPNWMSPQEFARSLSQLLSESEMGREIEMRFK